MAGISNYLADKINDWLHGNTGAFTPASTYYYALMTALPTASGGGTEVTGGSYVRKSIANNTTNWPAASGGFIANGVAMTWVTPSADWGLVVGIAVYDASTAGNLLFFTPISAPVSVLSGQPFSFPAGAGKFTFTGGISIYLTNKLLDWLFNGGTYTVPATTHFGLMTAASSQSSAGTETSGGSYARAAFANDATDWPDSVAQTKTNGGDIDFPTASTNWTGPEVAVTEFDAASSGNQLTFGALGTPVSVNSGGAPSVPTGSAIYSVN